MNVKQLSALAKEKNIDFLEKLRVDKENFHFMPVAKEATREGLKLQLGFSIYALKLFYMNGEWENLNKEKQISWVKYINNFQNSIKPFPANSFIDNEYINYFKNNSFKIKSKDSLKIILNSFGGKNYELHSRFIQNSIRAETKQCIATLEQIGMKPLIPYTDFPKDDLEEFLDQFDWSKPWSAGAQFSGLSVFIKTQISDESKKEEFSEAMSRFISSKVNSQDGTYYSGSQPSKSQAVNGAMKVLTGLDWLERDIHYPKKLIDLCLETIPNSEGCDLVDIVYVLFRCSSETSYRKSDIISYIKNLELQITKHFYPNEGGFSYFINKSQHNYYGVKISKGADTPDIHGTILLTWALAMMHEIVSPSDNNWKIIKP